ncbi:MAG TPA: NIPSNAP family protein [Micromonosporaceae bacterium]|jgi:hypothetical protein
MIVELRQYTLHPGRRDTLIELFDREFVESQEACGMRILGQFRDLDDPDRFVWLRSFDTMEARADALAAFYYGPVWKEHAAAANATMIDSDNVLLLRPSTGVVPTPPGPRPAAGATEVPASVFVATIDYFDRPYTGKVSDSWLQTEYAENTFPGLPVRTGEHALVRIRRFGNLAAADASREPDPGQPSLRTERLRLSPTARSVLR